MFEEDRHDRHPFEMIIISAKLKKSETKTQETPQKTVKTKQIFLKTFVDALDEDIKNCESLITRSSLPMGWHWSFDDL